MSVCVKEKKKKRERGIFHHELRERCPGVMEAAARYVRRCASDGDAFDCAPER